MPTYAYTCDACGHDFEINKPMAKSATPEGCPQCGGSTRKMVNWDGNAIFKGDGWVSKNNRIRGQMDRKNKILKAKEREAKMDGLVPKIVPNVDGEMVSSWKEAKKLAKSKGKDTRSYDQKIISER